MMSNSIQTVNNGGPHFLCETQPQASLIIHSNYPYPQPPEVSSTLHLPVPSQFPLLLARYSDNTVKLYTKAVRDFLYWCRLNGLAAPSIDVLDIVVTRYVHYLWSCGKGKDEATKVIYGIFMYYPRCRHKLPTSMQSLRGWYKLVPSKHYPPIAYNLAVLISCKMASNGLFMHGLGCLLSFECYLRIGELLGIKVQDIADNGDPRFGFDTSNQHMAILLPHTKTGPNKWVTVRDSNIQYLIRHSILRASPPLSRDDYLFPFSQNHFRSIISCTLSSLGLDHIHYVPHSFRHGGATKDFMNGMSIEDIKVRGRWSSTQSVLNYLQSGRAILLSMSYPPHISKQASTLAVQPLFSFLLSSLGSSSSP